MSFLLSTDSFSKIHNYSIHDSRKSSKRGVSEIIGTMILLAVTVAGGLVVFVIVQNSDPINFVIEEQETLNPNVIPKLKLSGYDTRDDIDLYGIDEINNGRLVSVGSPDFLCASSCTTTTSDNEFVILRVRNDADVLVDITTISINEVEHTFTAASVSNNSFSQTTINAVLDGEFIIISGFGTGSLIQETASSLPEGSEKRLVIRLSGSLSDITLNANIRVVINSSVETTQLLIVPAGSII